MPVHSSLTTIVAAATSYYRFTSQSFLTTNLANHVNVVDGQGAKLNPDGGRYSPPIVETVYLTEDTEACVAEKMFYFHREIVQAIDELHLPKGLLPPFQKKFVMWEVEFQNAITDVADINLSYSFFGVFPFLVHNPSQDYHHLKDRRVNIQANGYKGLRAPSARSKRNGSMIVLFNDQSKNVKTITPYEMEFRLICTNGSPFINHTTDMLDFSAAGEVRATGPNIPTGFSSSWKTIYFNR